MERERKRKCAFEKEEEERIAERIIQEARRGRKCVGRRGEKKWMKWVRLLNFLYETRKRRENVERRK